MAVMYLHLDYEAYKALEQQAREFAETTHKSTGGFYHKSWRVKVAPDLIIEFHGPLVGGYGHQDEDDKKAPGEPGAGSE
jgi:hypothetical protein